MRELSPSVNATGEFFERDCIWPLLGATPGAPAPFTGRYETSQNRGLRAGHPARRGRFSRSFGRAARAPRALGTNLAARVALEGRPPLFAKCRKARHDPAMSQRAVGPLSCLLATLVLFGCSNAEELQALQKQAETRVASIEEKARAQVAEARKEAEDVRVLMTQSVEQAQAKLKEAQDSAEQLLKEAKVSAEQAEKDAAKALAKARDAYKGEARAKLATLNDEVRELNAKISKAKGKVKSEAQAKLKDVTALQKQLAKDIAAFDKATLDTFKEVKNEVNKHLAELKTKLTGLEKVLK